MPVRQHVHQLADHLFVVKVMAVEAVARILTLVPGELGARVVQVVGEERKAGQMLVEPGSLKAVIYRPAYPHGGR